PVDGGGVVAGRRIVVVVGEHGDLAAKASLDHAQARSRGERDLGNAEGTDIGAALLPVGVAVEPVAGEVVDTAVLVAGDGEAVQTFGQRAVADGEGDYRVAGRVLGGQHVQDVVGGAENAVRARAAQLVVGWGGRVDRV